MSILQACEPEPRAASLKRFPPKNPKTGIMPQYGISYMRGTSYNYANTRGNFLSNRANQRESDSNNFNSFSELLTYM